MTDKPLSPSQHAQTTKTELKKPATAKEKNVSNHPEFVIAYMTPTRHGMDYPNRLGTGTPDGEGNVDLRNEAVSTSKDTKLMTYENFIKARRDIHKLAREDKARSGKTDQGRER